LKGVESQAPGAAKNKGPDITMLQFVGSNGLQNGFLKVLGGEGNLSAIDLAGIEKPLDVLLETEHLRASRGLIAADTLEPGRAVMKSMRADVNVRLIPIDKLTVVPNCSRLRGCTHEEKDRRLGVTSQFLELWVGFFLAK
jgi:hypothetical protein